MSADDMLMGRQTPVRLCCGHRHAGARCPDGKVVCCICFNRFDPSDLSLEGGMPVDVCTVCAIAEQGVPRGTVDPWDGRT